MLLRLEPLSGRLYRALEEALAIALAHCRQHEPGARPNAYIVPPLVRFHVLIALRRHGWDVTEEELDLGVEAGPNNGILLKFEGCEIRILKSDDGLLPVAGKSLVRQGFYAQPLIDDEHVDVLRLVILWDHTGDALLPLEIVCPKRGGRRREDTDVHFQVPMPHPLELLVPRQVDAADEDLDDLDIVRKDDTGRERGTGSAPEGP